MSKDKFIVLVASSKSPWCVQIYRNNSSDSLHEYFSESQAMHIADKLRNHYEKVEVIDTTPRVPSEDENKEWTLKIEKFKRLQQDVNARLLANEVDFPFEIC